MAALISGNMWGWQQLISGGEREPVGSDYLNAHEKTRVWLNRETSCRSPSTHTFVHGLRTHFWYTFLIHIANAFLIHRTKHNKHNVLVSWLLFWLILTSSDSVNLDIQAGSCYESGSGKVRLGRAHSVFLNHSSCHPWSPTAIKCCRIINCYKYTPIARFPLK